MEVYRKAVKLVEEVRFESLYALLNKGKRVWASRNGKLQGYDQGLDGQNY